MKKILILILIGVGFMFLFKKKVVISDIKSFHFSYTTSTMMDASILYELKCDDKIVATIKPELVPYEKAKTFEVDKPLCEELENILNKYNVGSWDDFRKSDPNVLDGNSFSLSIVTKDKKVISASGYMMYPKNYREVKSEIEGLFSKLEN